MRIFKKIFLLFIVFILLAIILLVLSLSFLLNFGKQDSLELVNDNKEPQIEQTQEENIISENNQQEANTEFINQIDSIASIQADVTLTGSGTGYHAKLLVQTPKSAVSFGLQFDTAGPDEYRNETAFIFENIYSNNQGEQVYSRTGFAELNHTYNILLAVQDNGTVQAYVDQVLVGEVNNPELIDQHLTLSLEGSARLNKDSVDAVFSNIKIKDSNGYNENIVWKSNIKETNDGIKVISSDEEIRIVGTIEGLSENEDWDSAYDKVSGVVQFPI